MLPMSARRSCSNSVNPLGTNESPEKNVYKIKIYTQKAVLWRFDMISDTYLPNINTTGTSYFEISY